MPELPEVETTRRGLDPLIVGQTIVRVVVRVPKLRWPIPPHLSEQLQGETILAVERRAKYLLLRCPSGSILLHLGMTGTLRVLAAATPPEKHDHIDLCFADGRSLRFSDPRRFGALLWVPDNPLAHPLLAELGPEPFATEMDGAYLFARSRGRRVAVKPFIMDQKVVVGVGNIYASEALFRAGIHPSRAAGAVTEGEYEGLAGAIHQVLSAAILAGGTTLRDFQDAHGQPGYFSLQLQVYGRGGAPCPQCGQAISVLRQGQRSTFFCPVCQPL